jgi:hypothetical protein
LRLPAQRKELFFALFSGLFPIPLPPRQKPASERFIVEAKSGGKKLFPKMFDNISRITTLLIITGLLTIANNNCRAQDGGELNDTN